VDCSSDCASMKSESISHTPEGERLLTTSGGTAENADWKFLVPRTTLDTSTYSGEFLEF